jgi:hypothetical protein
MAVVIAPAVGWASYTHEGESELTANPAVAVANQSALVCFVQGVSTTNSYTQGFPH